MGANDKNLKITKQVFGGDGGAESKIQNELLVQLDIKLYSIIETMNTTQLDEYKINLQEKGYDKTKKENALKVYKKIKEINK